MKRRTLSIFKVFEKKKKVTEEPKEEQKVSVEELDSWLADRINDELRGPYAQAEEIRRQIQDSILSIRQTIREMVGAESRRGALIAAVEKAADLPSTAILTFEDVVQLRERVAQDIAHLGEAWKSYKATAQKSARSNTMRLYAQLKQLDGEFSRLTALITTNSSRVTALERCQEQAKLLTTRVKEAREMAEKLKGLEDELESLESIRANTEDQIGRIKSTPEFEASARVRGELLALENRRTEIMSRVHDDFSSLTRPLGKYGHAAGPSKEKRDLLDSYMSETPRALSDKNDEAIQEILSDLRKYVLRGSVEIKNPEKTILNIERMMAELPRLGQEYRTLTGQMETVQSHVNTTAEEDFKTLEASLREAREAIGKVTLESREIRERQPQLNSEIDTMVSAVEHAVYENFEIPVSLALSKGNVRTTSQSTSVSGNALQVEQKAGSGQTSSSHEARTEPIAALKEEFAKGKIDKTQFDRLAKARYDYLKHKTFSELSDSEFQERLTGFEGLKVS
jgi:DNA repair exonuclease SbcCD ATPase subunit